MAGERSIIGSCRVGTSDHLPLAPDGDRSPSLEPVAVAEPLVGARGDLDAAGDPVGLHAAGSVDGVAPQVIAELAGPDHPGLHRAGIDANPDLQRLAAGVGAPGHLLL